jgi:hypothetical protein
VGILETISQIPQEDFEAAELDPGQEVSFIVFPASDQSAEVMQPSEEAFDLAAVAQVFGQSVQEASQGAIALPLLEATRAGLKRRIAIRQIVLGCRGALNSQNPVQHRVGIPPRSAAPIGALTRASQRPMIPVGISHRPSNQYPDLGAGPLAHPRRKSV